MGVVPVLGVVPAPGVVSVLGVVSALVLVPPTVCSAQSPPLVPFSQDAFPDHIADAEPLLVNVSEFVQLPGVDGSPARLQNLVDVPGARRLVASTDRGALWAVSYDGTQVSPYLHVGQGQSGAVLPREPAVETGGFAVATGGLAVAARGLAVATGGLAVAARGLAVRGFDGVAFHPNFAAAGSPGFGKFYTLLEVSDTEPPADFTPGHGSGDLWDTVLLEWTARDPSAWTYDGGLPRELMRIEQPYQDHNAGGGAIDFRAGADPSAPDYGLLYIGLGDGGGVGDPLGLAQDLGNVYGKLLRIDPLGSNSANGRYGVPADNPFAGDGREDTLGEIWAYGLRHPDSFGWDALTGALYVADIGEAAVEEISVVSAGGNLGWSAWEGSFKVVRRRGLARRIARAWSWGAYFATGAGFTWDNGHDIGTAGVRGDPNVTYPVVEYDRYDPLFWLTGYVAVTGVVVCRDCNVPQLNGKVLFGDLPSGVLMCFPADGAAPRGGPKSIRQVLLVEGPGDGPEGPGKTLLKLVQEKRIALGRVRPGQRVDLRFGTSASGDVFLLNKRDGVIRRLDGPPRSRRTQARRRPPAPVAEHEVR